MNEDILAADAPFFRDRANRRRPGVSRSKRRAAALAPHLGIDLNGLRGRSESIIVVVGSKGKGTTATYASALLAAAGMKVGTLTSPGLRSNRERIRVDGVAVAADAYAALRRQLETALQATVDLPDEGYLSPTGLFTLVAIRHFIDTGCDAWVLEAGMGGSADEVSLLAPGAVAVTPIFGEHLGIAGDTVADIARNKLGVITPETRAVATAPQPDTEVRRLVRSRAGAARLVEVDDRQAPKPGPPGLIGVNAALGVTVGAELLRIGGRPSPPASVTGATMATVALPGRLSIHHLDGQIWGLDSAIDGRGASGALRWFRTVWGPPDTVLICIPDGKDREGVLAALTGEHLVPVRVAAVVSPLSFDRWEADLPWFAAVDATTLGRRILALGTVSFIGEVLDRLSVDTERSFQSPRREAHPTNSAPTTSGSTTG